MSEEKTIKLVSGEKFKADKEMVNLICELNQLGLKTRSHCYGHTTKAPHIAIWFDNIENVQIRTLANGKKDLVITWKRLK